MQRHKFPQSLKTYINFAKSNWEEFRSLTEDLLSISEKPDYYKLQRRTSYPISKAARLADQRDELRKPSPHHSTQQTHHITSNRHGIKDSFRELLQKSTSREKLFKLYDHWRYPVPWKSQELSQSTKAVTFEQGWVISIPITLREKILLPQLTSWADLTSHQRLAYIKSLNKLVMASTKVDRHKKGSLWSCSPPHSIWRHADN